MASDSHSVPDGHDASKASVVVAKSAVRVLVVEDEELVAVYFRALLDAAGYVVTVVGDAHSAIREFDAQPDAWSLVIVDRALPGPRGDRIVRHIAGVRPSLPVILISGDVPPDDELDVVAFLEKPCTADAVLSAVRSALEREVQREAQRKVGGEAGKVPA